MASLSPKAAGPNHAGAKARIETLFEKFRVSDADITAYLPVPFENLPEKIICSRKTLEMFAHYLLNVHIIEANKNSGEHVSFGTAQGYMNILMEYS